MKIFLNDERDLNLLLHAIKSLSLGVLLPFFFIIEDKTTLFLFSVIYVLVYIYLLKQFIIMFHDISHNDLLKKEYKILNMFLNSILGILYGMPFSFYYDHHILMHHLEDNNENDLSSTLQYKRDSIRDFTRYYFKLLFSTFALCKYLKIEKSNRLKYSKKYFLYESLYLITGITLISNFTLIGTVVFIIPILLTRTTIIIVNWAEHAFIDLSNYKSAYGFSVNIIGEKVNSKCFNVGYQISHHINPLAHYTEMPQIYEKNISKYIDKGVVIFKDVHYPDIWFYLMKKDYKTLSKLFVNIGFKYQSQEDIINLLKSRVMPIYSNNKVM